jgi:hypothetical protein
MILKHGHCLPIQNALNQSYFYKETTEPEPSGSFPDGDQQVVQVQGTNQVKHLRIFKLKTEVRNLIGHA